jgi:cellulose synthase/poly-beta-1,6-N-acetylglucosamine synthase-like glycosyltransferase
MKPRRSQPLDWVVGVVIPARNEAAHIARCLCSVLSALDAFHRPGYIAVVADSCVDETASIARQLLGPRGRVIECGLGSVGRARRLGTAAVLEHYQGRSPATLWIANTDADTQVPPHWLQRQIEFAISGYHGIAGIVEIDPVAHEGGDVSGLLMADYIVRPDGTHSHVHGANMAFRGDAYLSAGGWSDALLAEDHCLWNRLQQLDLRLATSARVKVKTSGRLDGRAAGGFATTLKAKFQHIASLPSMLMDQ